MDQVVARIPRDVLYRRTGIQFMPINTLFQLYAHERMQPGELAHAYRLLLIPDLLYSWLCGSLTTEQTNATTTQCWDPIAKAWAADLLNQLSIPSTMLPPVVEAGTVLGEILPELRGDLHTTPARRLWRRPSGLRMAGGISVPARGHWLDWSLRVR